jgi:hypothetical protein
MARNPTPLVIPCHRVLAADGIGGFSPEIAIKESLLAMEKKRITKDRKMNFSKVQIPPETDLPAHDLSVRESF